MSAAKIDLEIDKGQTFRRGFLFSSAGIPINPAGYSVRIQARVAKTEGATLILDRSTTLGTLTWDETAPGQVNMILSRDETRALPEGKYFWELELTTPTNESDILAGGSLKVIIGVIQ